MCQSEKLQIAVPVEISKKRRKNCDFHQMDVKHDEERKRKNKITLKYYVSDLEFRDPERKRADKSSFKSLHWKQRVYREVCLQNRKKQKKLNSVRTTDSFRMFDRKHGRKDDIVELDESNGWKQWKKTMEESNHLHPFGMELRKIFPLGSLFLERVDGMKQRSRGHRYQNG